MDADPEPGAVPGVTGAATPAVIIDVGPERYGECLDVLREAFATEVAGYGITAANTPSNPAFWGPDAVASVVGKEFSLFAITRGDTIVGCAFAGASRSRPRTWELRHLAVTPGYRHLGLGAALVEEAAGRARAAGATVLRIGIVAENVRLSGWYRRLGFVSVGAQRYPGMVFTVEHLELPLAVGSSHGIRSGVSS